MKLLFCFKCEDIVKLPETLLWRGCKCGAVQGRYLKDGWHAEFTGDGCLLGFSNSSFVKAIRQYTQGHTTTAKKFTAFVIPYECATVKKLR